MLGTPKYISPEQARGQPLDGSADIYALGVVAFELLAGRAPFVGNDSVELVAKHITLQAPSPSDFNTALPQIADDMCRAMLDKEPGKRPNVAAVRAMLEQLKVAPPSTRVSATANQRAKATETHPQRRPPVAAVAPTPTQQVATSRRGVPWWGLVIGALGVFAIGIYFFGYPLDRGDVRRRRRPRRRRRWPSRP